jgi:integrase
MNPKPRQHRQDSCKGSVRQVKSGSWQVRITEPGTRKQKSFGTHRTKRLAEIKLNELLGSYDRAEWDFHSIAQLNESKATGKAMTLSEAAKQYAGTQTRNGKPLTPKTIECYESYLRAPLASLASKPISEISTQQVDNWFQAEKNAAHPSQRAKAYSLLKAVMTWAHERDYIAANPCRIRGGGSYKNEQPEILTEAQVHTLVGNAQPMFAAIYSIAAWGGLRKGEILELRLKDIEIVQERGLEWIQVSVKRALTWPKGVPTPAAPKTAKSIRTLKLFQYANKPVLDHIRNLSSIDPEQLLFPGKPGTNEHFAQHQLNRTYAKDRAAIGSSVRFHSSRGFQLTYCTALGMPARDVMDRGGHTNLTTNMLYQHNTGQEVSYLLKATNAA